MPADLQHLSEEEINSLILRYYNGEKITDLISEFRIDAKPSQLIKLFPPKVSDIVCKYCGTNMIQHYNSRAYGSGISSPQCLTCKHKEDRYCYCKNCQNAVLLKQKEEKLAKQAFIKNFLSGIFIEQIHVDELSLEERIYLGAFLRAGISESFDYVNPIESFHEPLAPNGLTSEIVKKLNNRDKRIISVHHSTNIEAFTDIDYVNGSLSYFPDKVKWQINVISTGVNKVPLIDSIMNPENLELDSQWAYLFWKKVALHECLEFFSYSIESIFRSEYSIGEKTIATFEELLKHYSVSEIYNIINNATTNAARFKLEHSVSNKHAINTIIGKALSYGEKALAENWQIKKFNLRYELPKSVLSKLFFDRILKIGDRGFYEKPQIIELHNI